jgi:hypothetical protein
MTCFDSVQGFEAAFGSKRLLCRAICNLHKELPES